MLGFPVRWYRLSMYFVGGQLAILAIVTLHNMGVTTAQHVKSCFENRARQSSEGDFDSSVAVAAACHCTTCFDHQPPSRPSPLGCRRIKPTQTSSAGVCMLGSLRVNFFSQRLKLSNDVEPLLAVFFLN